MAHENRVILAEGREDDRRVEPPVAVDLDEIGSYRVFEAKPKRHTVS